MAALVLFDLDGTLSDPREGILASLRFAFAGLGLEPPSESSLLAAIGPPLQETFARHLPPDSLGRVPQAIALYRERFDAQGWRENRPYPGAAALLAGVNRRGWRAALATSKPTLFAERIVRHFGLASGLCAVHGSELDGRHSDKAELLAHVLATQGAESDACVMVGDRRHDVAGARAVGVASIGVTWGYGGRDELVAAGATRICDTPSAVLAALDELILPADAR